MSLLELKSVSKSFGNQDVLKDISLSIKSNERLALIGPNGAGKSTLLNILTGTLKLQSGSIQFREEEITTCGVAHRNYLGIARTLQHSSVFPNLSIYENLLGAMQRGSSMLKFSPSARNSVDELLERVSLQESSESLALNLAYGQKRLLEIAMALATRPKLLLMDEPMAGLDRADVESISELLNSLENVAILIVEHNVDAVFRLSDRVAVLNQGELIADGSPEEIRANQHVQQVYLGSGVHDAQN